MGIRRYAWYLESFAKQKEVNFDEQTPVRILHDESSNFEKEPVTEH